MAERRIKIQYSLILSVYWMIQAIFLVFVVPLLRGRGFDNLQIGILLAVRSLSCIVFQPVVATFSDKNADKVPLKYVIAVLIVISYVTTEAFARIEFGYIGSLIIFGLLGATLTALYPLYNSLAMQYLAAGVDVGFSISRGCGSIAYAVMCIILGFVVDSRGVEATLTLQVAMLIVSLILIITFKTCDGSVEGNKEKPHSTLQVLSENKAYSIFLLASVLLFVGNNMSTTFLVDVVDKLGGSNKDVGYCQFVLAAAEFPIALMFMRIKGRIGTERIMKICAVFMVAKVLAVLLAPNIPVLIAVHVLQMAGAGLYWSGSVYFVNEQIQGCDRVKGHSLVAIFSTGLGSGIGSVISGQLSKYGVNTVLLCGGICALAGAVSMLSAMNISEKTEYVVKKMAA